MWEALAQSIHPPEVVVLANQWIDVFELMGLAGSVGLGVGLLRSVLDVKGADWTWWMPVQNVAAALLVSTLFALTVYDFDIGFKLKVSLTGICAYVASDILMGLKKISAQLASDPVLFIKTFKEMLLGRKAPP